MADFKVGDLVRIRSWEDMRNESGGEDEDGDLFIGNNFFFGSNRCFCGEEFIISEMAGDICYGYDEELDLDFGLLINTSMIELVNDREFDDSEINSFLGEVIIK